MYDTNDDGEGDTIFSSEIDQLEGAKRSMETKGIDCSIGCVWIVLRVKLVRNTVKGESDGV